jgi:hypothetical protein
MLELPRAIEDDYSAIVREWLEILPDYHTQEDAHLACALGQVFHRLRFEHSVADLDNVSGWLTALHKWTAYSPWLQSSQMAYPTTSVRYLSSHCVPPKSM